MVLRGPKGDTAKVRRKKKSLCMEMSDLDLGGVYGWETEKQNRINERHQI